MKTTQDRKYGIHKILSDNGYSEARFPANTYFDKEFECSKRMDDICDGFLCDTNDKISIIASVIELQGNESLSLEIRAETSDNHWIQVNFYSMPLTAIDTKLKLNSLEVRLVEAWISLNKQR